MDMSQKGDLNSLIDVTHAASNPSTIVYRFLYWQSGRKMKGKKIF